MAEQTPYQYYDYDNEFGGDDNYGKYQYVSLSEIINAMVLETQENDSYLKGTKRSKIIYHAKQGIRELNREVDTEERAFEITVPDSLVWPLPQDYVSYLGIYAVKRNNSTGSFNLYELDVDYNIHTAIGYLQDSDAAILFDEDGNILEADSSNAIAHAYNREQISQSYLGGNPTKDTSKYSKHGLFTINEQRGIIVFSSDLADREVVIKYKSDGLHAELSGSTIYIHKNLKKALEDYIYSECISRNRNVPDAEKYRANNKYKSSRHKAVLARSDFNMSSILKHSDSATKLM